MRGAGVGVAVAAGAVAGAVAAAAGATGGAAASVPASTVMTAMATANPRLTGIRARECDRPRHCPLACGRAGFPNFAPVQLLRGRADPAPGEERPTGEPAARSNR